MASNGPQHDLSRYAGTYSHPGYGTFIVDHRPEGLVQTYEGRTFPVAPYDGETFETRFRSTENSLVHLTMSFQSDTQGRVVAVTVPLIPDIPKPRFVRQ
ncbi:MAG: DUF3471 domain-containing protein [Planctomycetota bacterium]